MHDGIYGNGGGGQGPPSVGSGRQSYTHQGLFFVCFVLFYIVLFCIVLYVGIILHNFRDNIMKKVSIKKSFFWDGNAFSCTQKNSWRLKHFIQPLGTSITDVRFFWSFSGTEIFEACSRLNVIMRINQILDYCFCCFFCLLITYFCNGKILNDLFLWI